MKITAPPTSTGVTAKALGELGATAGVIFHELSPQTGSLEDAFLDATASSVQYHGTQVEGVAR